MFFKKKSELSVTEFAACISGEVIALKDVKDDVFSSGAMGGGVGIEPIGNTVFAPCGGVVTVVMEGTRHAIGLELNNGAEILIHVGIDTVEMGGEGFKLYVKREDKVKKGDKLIGFDRKLIQERGYEATTIILLTNADEFSDVEYISGIQAEHEKTVIMKFNKQ